MVTRRDAVRKAQVILKSTRNDLVADGLWGPKTDSAYVQSPQETKVTVETSLARDGFAIMAIRQRFAATGKWIAEPDALLVADRASDKVGLRLSYLRMILQIEPQVRKNPANGQKEYNIESISPNGLYRGLFQMGAPAWEDARAVMPEIGSYDVNWRDPFLNAVAAAAFAKSNIGYSRQIYNMKGDLSDQVLYAMHNQGHTFIRSAMTGGKGYYYDGQSQTAKSILADASKELRNSKFA